jgi:putative ABC transport system permease protein
LLSTIDLSIAIDLHIDYRVLGFAIMLSLATGIAFGLAPALSATRIDLLPTLHDDGETRSADHPWLTFKNALVVFQVAVSVVLLGATSLFLQVLAVSRAQRVGFAVDGVAMLETDPRYAGYPATQLRNVFEEIRRRVGAIPGVESVVLVRGLPMQTTGAPVVVDTAAAANGTGLAANAIWAAPGYFDVLRIPIVYGRAIDDRDRRDTPRVAVISEAMARQYFGAANAVGRRFRLEAERAEWIEVVGVVRDTATADRGGDLVDPTPYLFYRATTQWDASPTTVVARTSLDATDLVVAMRREIRSVDAALPVVAAKTMAQHLEDSLTAPKAVATLLATLGALGLGLAGVGLYAVVAFGVSRRSREIGIRMALGARSEQVVWTIAREVAMLVGVGTGVGLTVSWLAILALRRLTITTPGVALYRPTADPLALLAIAVFMAIVGCAAAYIPARRAATMNPLAALRHD